MAPKNPRLSPKERNLLKGAMRRVFSRSDLRRNALQLSLVSGHKDANRPRVTKWSKCPQCKQMTPTYLMEIDHQSPVIPLDTSLEDMTWDEVVDRIWCDASNLIAICKPCHKLKSREETKARRLYKKGKAK